MSGNTESLQDFIIRRRREIDELEAPLKAQLEALRVERDQLRRAGLAIGTAVESAPCAPVAAKMTRLSLKDMAIKTLARHPHGLNANQLVAEMNREFDVNFSRTTLSPQLTRMKDAGLLVLLGKDWFTATHFRTKVSAPDPSHLEGERSGAFGADPEAQGVEAAPGGST